MDGAQEAPTVDSGGIDETTTDEPALGNTISWKVKWKRWFERGSTRMEETESCVLI